MKGTHIQNVHTALFISIFLPNKCISALILKLRLVLQLSWLCFIVQASSALENKTNDLVWNYANNSMNYAYYISASNYVKRALQINNLLSECATRFLNISIHNGKFQASLYQFNACAAFEAMKTLAAIIQYNKTDLVEFRVFKVYKKGEILNK